MLTFTLVGPTIGATLDRLRTRAEATTTAQAEKAQTSQMDLQDLRERLDELTQESRERVAKQMEYLRAQAQQMQKQSRQLRKSLRAEARQRQKLLKRAREAGVDWSQEMLKLGEQFTGEVIERGSKASQELVERGQELSHDLTKRSKKLSRDLAKRSRKATRDLADRGGELLGSRRQQSRAWTFVGFGVGMLVAGAITYRLVRGRAARRQAEEESFEIPPIASMNGIPANPAEQAGTPDMQLEEVDLVFFSSEEEASQQE